MKTVGRLVRLRCCEWTIWTLPLVAHEFGHIVIEESKEISNRIETISQAHLLALQEAFGPGAKTEPLPRAELEEYLADAYATYVMGPAFACAAILLRLNPLHLPAGTREPGLDLRARPDYPRDARPDEPAHRVTEQLRHGHRASSQGLGPDVGVCGDFQGGRGRSADPGAQVARPPRQDHLDAVQMGFRRGEHDDPSQGWSIAQDWAMGWHKL